MSEMVIAFPEGNRTYPVPQFEQLTYKELATVERITGVPAARWDEGMQSITFPVALAYIATQRAGETFTVEDLEQLPGTSIAINIEDDELVPTEAAEGGDRSGTTSEEDGTPAS
jgi:hypothetical protein